MKTYASAIGPHKPVPDQKQVDRGGDHHTSYGVSNTITQTAVPGNSYAMLIQWAL